MKHLQFIDEYGSFSIKQPENTSYLYFPLASETGLKSSLTPNLGGDSKTDQETFLLEPVSAENLHNNRSVRNFWLVCEKEGIFSATGASAKQEAVKFTALQDQSKITAGFMWHTLERFSSALSLETRITSFIPEGSMTGLPSFPCFQMTCSTSAPVTFPLLSPMNLVVFRLHLLTHPSSWLLPVFNIRGHCGHGVKGFSFSGGLGRISI